MSASDLAAVEFKGLRTTSKLPTRHLDGRAWAESWGTAARPQEEKEAGLAIPKAGISQPTSARSPSPACTCSAGGQLSSAKALSLPVAGLKPQPLEDHPHCESGEKRK